MYKHCTDLPVWVKWTTSGIHSKGPGDEEAGTLPVLQALCLVCKRPKTTEITVIMLHHIDPTHTHTYFHFSFSCALRILQFKKKNLCN